MKIADMLESKMLPPTRRQLDRVAFLALLAWDNKQQIRFGFSFTKQGIMVYAKQRRPGKSVSREGPDLAAVVKEVEDHLIIVAAERTKMTPERIRELANAVDVT